MPIETSVFTVVMLLLAGPSISARATTYYVAPGGSDANAGTNLDVPFQTIRQASSIMIAGDICFIRGGVYRETLTAIRSGTADAPITFAAYSNEVVTISADDLVASWTPLSNGIYQASVDWDLGEGYNQVFVDGSMAHEAQYPHYGSGDLFHPATVSVTVNGDQISSPAFDGQPDNHWAGSWFAGGIGLNWEWQTAHVLYSTGAVLTVDASTESQDFWFTGQGVGYLWGLPQFLGGDNEWYLQTNSSGNVLDLRVANGDAPSSHAIEMKNRIWCVDYNGQNYVTVSGLNLWGGAVQMNGNNNILQNCNGQFLSHFMIIPLGVAENGAILPGGGVGVEGFNHTVRGCTLCNTAGSGILTGWIIGATNTLISRNLIYNVDYSGTCASCIGIGGRHEVVIFNTAHDSGRDVLRPEGAGTKILFNDLFNPGLMCKDLGCIYNWGVNGLDADGTPTRIAYNWCHDNYNPAYAPLIYLDNFDCNFIMDHNVCWNSGSSDCGVRVNGPCFNQYIYNNTFFNCANVGAITYDSWPDANPDPTFWTSDIYQYFSSNNLYLAGSPQQQLLDWTNEDFRLQTGSPAIDAGVTIPDITDGYAGAEPDLGAYEFGRVPWTPGVYSKPTLLISPSSNGGITLAASPDAAFYRLLVSTNLDSWAPMTNTAAAQANLWTISLPAPSSGNSYFRLQQQ